MKGLVWEGAVLWLLESEREAWKFYRACCLVLDSHHLAQAMTRKCLIMRMYCLKNKWAGEIAQQLRMLLLLQKTEVQLLAPTWQLTATCSSSPRRSDTLLWPRHVHKHACRQSTHTHKIKSKKINFKDILASYNFYSTYSFRTSLQYLWKPVPILNSTSNAIRIDSAGLSR